MTASDRTHRVSRTRFTVLAGAVAVAAFVGAFGALSFVFSAATVASPFDILRIGGGGALGEADGVVPSGATVFDDRVPAIANLDPALLGALRRAATAAGRDGIEFPIDSGWRSPAYQAELLREAVATYGSAEEAARWVATPATS